MGLTNSHADNCEGQKNLDAQGCCPDKHERIQPSSPHKVCIGGGEDRVQPGPAKIAKMTVSGGRKLLMVLGHLVAD